MAFSRKERFISLNWHLAPFKSYMKLIILIYFTIIAHPTNPISNKLVSLYAVEFPTFMLCAYPCLELINLTEHQHKIRPLWNHNKVRPKKCQSIILSKHNKSKISMKTTKNSKHLLSWIKLASSNYLPIITLVLL